MTRNPILDGLRQTVSRWGLTVAPALIKRRRFAHLLDAQSLGVSAREPEFQLVPWLIPEGTAFVDIGANRGEYLFVVEHQRREVPLVAFEPIPSLASVLSKLFPSADVHAAALSDKTGTATFKIPYLRGQAFLTRGTLEVEYREPGEERHVTLTVPLDTIDAWAASSPTPPGFMKIDVEGHEWAVLRGAAATLRQCRPMLLVEIEQRHHEDVPILDDIRAMQREFDYRVFFFDSSVSALVELAEPEQIRQDLALHKTRGFVNNFFFFPAERADAAVQLVAGRIQARRAGAGS